MNRRGFSLVELLIVVAIILVLAAIAIPNLLRSRLAANESSAVANLRVLNTSEVTYALTFNSGFSPGLNALGAPGSGVPPSPTAADLADPTLSGLALMGTNTSFVKGGYLFNYHPVGTFPNVQSYSFNADPVARGTTGQRSFFTNEPLVIRANGIAAATASDNPI